MREVIGGYVRGAHLHGIDAVSVLPPAAPLGLGESLSGGTQLPSRLELNNEDALHANQLTSQLRLFQTLPLDLR